MATIFVSGFSTSSGGTPGTHKMADKLSETLKEKIGPIKKLIWDEQDEACAFIEGAIGSKRNQPVVLVGHSFGGDSIVDVANQLKAKGICVDLMIQIDSVGIGDEKKPDNVEKGVNLWNASQDGIDGASNVTGTSGCEFF